MKVTTKKLSETKVELTVTLERDDMKVAEEKALERLAKEVQVGGFRKGKVPADIAKEHISDEQLSSTALDIAVRTTIPRAFMGENIAPLVIPNVEVTKFVPHESAEYKAEADIVPEIKLGEYKKLKIKKDDAKVKKSDIDDVLENVRNAYSEKKVAKKKAEMGDEVVIDFVGTRDNKDGEKFEGGSSKDFKLTLGSTQFIPGFEEGCVGHESGDRFDILTTFPKDYHEKSLAGKKANFNVLVKQVNETIKPALDDEFAKKCGPFKTIDALKKDIETNLAKQNEVKADEKFKDDIVREVIKNSKVAAPAVLVEDQIHMIKTDIQNNASRQGLTFEDYLKQTNQTEDDWKKSVTPIAEDRVKGSLILQKIAQAEKIEISDDLVDAKMNELREVYKKSKDAIKSLENPNVRQDIKNRMTIEKTLNFLVKENS